MDLTSPKIIKEILAKHGVKPSKGLGQNFLIDRNILDKIIEAAELKSTDTVLEVGPGIGTLTKELAQKANKIITIEKDKKMCEILAETLLDYKNVEIVNEDVLKTGSSLISSLRGVPSKARGDEAIPNQNNSLSCEIATPSPTGSARNDGGYKVVANIPYYITSPVIRKFLEENPPAGGQPEFMVLMLQKEVAQRICAKPPKMSLLAVSVQFYAEPKIVSYVSKNCFLPAPKVDSAIIKITPKAGGTRGSAELFFKIVKAGFSQPRKQLAGNLSKGLNMDKKETEQWLLKSNIQPKQRAETLSVEDWKNLAASL